MAPNLDIFMTTFPYVGKFFLAEEYFFMVLAADLRNKILPLHPNQDILFFLDAGVNTTQSDHCSTDADPPLSEVNRRRVALAVDDSPNDARRAVRRQGHR